MDENDLMIIATTGSARVRLVSNEAAQPGLPKIMANYKIPVCAMDEVKAESVNFLAFVKQSKAFSAQTLCALLPRDRGATTPDCLLLVL